MALWQDLYQNLNPAQQQAVEHGDGPLLVVAGPGSGKTTVITCRAAALVAGRGVDPRQLLVVTFTKAAADHMRDRTINLLGPRANGITFGTFHSLAYRILRREGGQPPRVMVEEEQFAALRGLLLRARQQADETAVQIALTELSNCRNNLEDPRSFVPRGLEPAVFQELYFGYQELKQAQGVVDFDDLLLQCLSLLQTSSEVLARYQRLFRYLMIDEFQDTNRLQFELVRLLAAPGLNVVAVGDDDQAIYAWRGASPRFLKEFVTAFKGCRQVVLDTNYRSTGSIVAVANRLISYNKGRFAKVIKTPRDLGAEPVVLRPADPAAEAAEAVKLAQEVAARGLPYDAMAVIYRTNDQAYVLAQALAQAGIPYQALGGLPNLYRRWQAQDLLAYLKLAVELDEPLPLLERIVNRPVRYIPRRALEEAYQIASRSGPGVTAQGLLKAFTQSSVLQPYQVERLIDLAGHLRRLAVQRAPQAISYVRTVIGYNDHLAQYAEESGAKLADISAILDDLEAMAPDVPLVQFLAQVEEFGERLREAPSRSEVPAVTLVTCHRAKGLEFPVVLVAGLTDGLLPHKGSDDPEEERRLAYVAMTRAQDELILSSPVSLGGRAAKPSPYLAEALGESAPGGADLVKRRQVQALRGPSSLPAGSIPVGAVVEHVTYGLGKVVSVDVEGRLLGVDFGGRKVYIDLAWALQFSRHFKVLGTS